MRTGDAVGPDEIGPYAVESMVARGGSGSVFKAVGGDGVAVAVKLLDRPDADAGAEAGRLRLVNNPHIVRVADTGHHEGHPWIATRWVEGRTLAHLVATEGPLTVGRAGRLIEQIAVAVDALHDAGIVHGDLSPRNMIVDLDDHLTLIDLGVAGAAGAGSGDGRGDGGGHSGGDGGLDTTATVAVHTTPRYAAPEVAAGALPGPASDRYALGVIAFEALTGGAPFPAVATPVAMLGHHLHTVPTTPSEERPNLPPRIDSAILRSLSKDPAERHDRAGSFADELLGRVGGPGAVPGVTAQGRGRGSLLRSNALRSNALRWIVPIGIAGFALFVGWSLLGGEPNSRDLEAAGDAASLPCNLTEVPGFEGPTLAVDFYSGDPEEPPIASLPDAGVGGSHAGSVGGPDHYGLYAEILAVNGGDEYVFDAWIQRQNEPAETGMWINYLDADFGLVTDVANRLPTPIDPEESMSGVRYQVRSQAPVRAAWAIPTFFKDSSGGSLLIDEVVFGSVDLCRLGEDGGLIERPLVGSTGVGRGGS